jgi:hypothetical protein
MCQVTTCFRKLARCYAILYPILFCQTCTVLSSAANCITSHFLGQITRKHKTPQRLTSMTLLPLLVLFLALVSFSWCKNLQSSYHGGFGILANKQSSLRHPRDSTSLHKLTRRLETIDQIDQEDDQNALAFKPLLVRYGA